MIRPFAILLLSALSASAASYYVDFSAGSDAAAGTSAGTAWKHAPTDVNATGVPSGTTLQSGDTVYFKGGVSYVTAGMTPVSGVTYDGNSAGNWGTGKAVLTDNHSNPGGLGFYAASSLANATFRSIWFKEFGGSATLPIDYGTNVAANAGYGIIMNGGSVNVTVRDCDFAELGYYFNQKPMAETSINGMGIRSVGVTTGLTITNCTFKRVNEGVNLNAGSITNLTVANCSFTDSICWCVDLGAAADNATFSGVTVKGCSFFDFYQFNASYWTGYGEWPHTDGIFCRVGGTPAYTNIVWTGCNFYNNTFYFTTGPGGGTAAIFLSYGPSANIYNNLFIHSGMSDASVFIFGSPPVAGTPQTVNVVNNTFYDWYVLNVNVDSVNDTAAPGTVRVLNNVFYDAYPGPDNNLLGAIDDGTLGDGYITANWFFNHNTYRTTNPTYLFYHGPTYRLESFSTLRSSYGWEGQGQLADPLFMDISQAFANTPNQNLRLATNSPARAAGTNLTAWALPGLAADRDGNPRPSSGAWDQGAYQDSTWALTLTGPWTLSGANWRIGQ